MSVKEWWGKLSRKLKHCPCEGPEARESLAVFPRLKGQRQENRKAKGERKRQRPSFTELTHWPPVSGLRLGTLHLSQVIPQKFSEVSIGGYLGDEEAETWRLALAMLTFGARVLVLAV